MSTKKRRQNAEKTRSRILSAAEKVFAERGLKGSRVKDIMKAARVTPSSIYYHFDGKEDLYKTVIENYYLTVQSRLLPIIIADVEPQEKMSQLIALGIDIMAESDHMARILLRESIDKGKYLNKVLSKPYLADIFEMVDQFVFSNIERKRDGKNDTIHLLSNLVGLQTIFFLAAPTIKEFWTKDVFSKQMIEERKKDVIDFVFNGIGHRFK